MQWHQIIWTYTLLHVVIIVLHVTLCYNMCIHYLSSLFSCTTCQNMLQHQVTSSDTCMYMYTYEYISATMFYDCTFNFIVTCAMSLSYYVRMSTIISWHVVMLHTYDNTTWNMFWCMISSKYNRTSSNNMLSCIATKL